MLPRMNQFLFAGACAGAMVVQAALAGETWPQFRGPDGSGHSDATGLPLTWSEQMHIKWKVPIHDRAWSSPVIWSNQVWLTTASEDGTKLYAICVDRDTGKITRDLHLFTVERPQFAHQFNTYASPTPVIEAGRVYVTFGSPGTACLDTRTGQVLWTRRDFVCNHFRGAGSSPILFGHLLIMNFDGSDHQFVVALDKETGQTVWRKERSIDFKDLAPDGQPIGEGDLRKAFSTPHVAEIEGQSILLSSGAKAHYAYDPLTGQELWRVEERTSHSAGTRPVVGLGLVFIPTGWSMGQLLAIHPGKGGEVIDANNPSAQKDAGQLRVVWKSKRNVPKKPSLLLVDDLLFSIDDNGVASCLEANSGKEVWRERVGGNYSASPIYAEDHIYFCSEEGKITVIKAGRKFTKLAENQLDDGFMASPAVAGKALFLRTKTHLYRVEDQEQPARVTNSLPVVRGETSPQTGQPEPLDADETPLFDGKTLLGWRQSRFLGSGKVQVENGKIVLGVGFMTGITWTNDLPRMDYEISLEAMRVEGSDFFCGLTFPVAENSCSLIVGGWGGNVVGLSSLDYADAANNETTQLIEFATGRWYKIRVRVQPGHIQAWVDEKKVADVKSAGRKVSIRSECEPSLPMGIASYSTKAALQNIRMKRL